MGTKTGKEKSARKDKTTGEERTAEKEKPVREEETAEKEKSVREEKTAGKEKPLREEETAGKEKSVREEKTAGKEKPAKKEKTAGNDSFAARNKKIFKWVGQACPSYLPLCMLKDAIGAFRPFLNTWLLAATIGGLAEGTPERQLCGIVLLIIGANLTLSLIQWALDKLLIVRRRRVSDGVDAAMTVKAMTLDYQVMEKAETQKMFTKIQDGMRYAGGLTNYCVCISSSVCAAFSAVCAAVLLIPLFATGGSAEAGGVSAFVNSGWGMLLFVAVLALDVLALTRINQAIEKIGMKQMERAVPGNRVFHYFFEGMDNYSQGKAIRVYHMLPLYRSLWGKYRKEQYEFWIESERDSCRVRYLGTAASVVTLFFLYVFLGIRVFSGLLTVGELTFYVATATSLTGYLNTVMNLNAYMQMTSGYIVLMADFLELANEKYDGTIPIEKRLDNEYELEFRDVSFHYPNSEELALDHISMKIRVGGKLAIVGPNGSGKSTFIKLLCRLYDPTEGEILLNGIDIRKYDYDEYRMIFSLVFQDFRLFSFSIAQNVAAGKDYDAARVEKCLEQAGLGERMKEMEHGIEELIYQQNDEAGVEISGGEAQKIAIARALYKDAPVVILDEPTAALDPVSEQEIYRRFDEMVEEKTAIYISHRMSSCRFCQQILVFDGGKIVQIGGHETLVREEEGLYAQLWNAQAQYYND